MIAARWQRPLFTPDQSVITTLLQNMLLQRY